MAQESIPLGSVNTETPEGTDESLEQFLESQQQSGQSQETKPSQVKEAVSAPVWEWKGKKYDPETTIRNQMLQSDYSRKTAELAEQRRQLEAERAQIAEAFQRSLRDVVDPNARNGNQNPFSNNPLDPNYDPVQHEVWNLKQQSHDFREWQQRAEAWQREQDNRVAVQQEQANIQSYLADAFNRPGVVDLPKEVKGRLYKNVLRELQTNQTGRSLDVGKVFEDELRDIETVYGSYVRHKAKEQANKKHAKFETRGGTPKGTSAPRELQVKEGQDPLDAAADQAYRDYT